MNELEYNFYTGFWHAPDGSAFVKNTFDRNNIVFIDISGDTWKTSYKGTPYYIYWSKLPLTEQVIKEAQTFVASTLNHRSPSCLTSYRVMLEELSRFFQDLPSLLALDYSDWELIRQAMPHKIAFAKSLFIATAVNAQDGRALQVAEYLQHWKRQRSKGKPLEYIRQWHPTRGAFTPREYELILKVSRQNGAGLSSKEHGLVVFLLLLIETLKRPVQILQVAANNVTSYEVDGIKVGFVTVPKAKAQTGHPPDDWDLSDHTLREIESFSARPDIKLLQQKYDRLVIWDCPSLSVHKQVSTRSASSSLKTLFRTVISPRTNEPLIVNPLRIRHHGGTRMAFNKRSREEIQEVLEHNDPASANAYIDAVLPFMAEEFAQLPSQFQELFKEINGSFFNGTVVEDVGTTMIPLAMVSDKPLIIGSCGRDTAKQGPCKEHPFTSCYNGCPFFEAWNVREVHETALAHVNALIEEQQASSKTSGRVVKDLRDTERSILGVLQQIEERQRDRD